MIDSDRAYSVWGDVPIAQADDQGRAAVPLGQQPHEGLSDRLHRSFKGVPHPSRQLAQGQGQVVSNGFAQPLGGVIVQNLHLGDRNPTTLKGSVAHPWQSCPVRLLPKLQRFHS